MQYKQAESARLRCRLQEHSGRNCDTLLQFVAALSARDTLRLAVKGGAKNLGRSDIGELAPGFAADFVAFRTDNLAFAGAQHDVVCALIFCSPGADQVHMTA